MKKILKMALTFMLLAFTGTVIAAAAGEEKVANTYFSYIRPTYEMDKNFETNYRSPNSVLKFGYADVGEPFPIDAYYAEYSYSQFKSGEAPYITLAEEVSINTSDYDKVYVQFEYAFSKKSDTEIKSGMSKVYVSTDGGKTYSNNGVTCTVTDSGKCARDIGNSIIGQIYTITSGDLKEIAGDGSVITNIKFVPVADSTPLKGSFRLYWFALRGESEYKYPEIPVLNELIYKTAAKTVESDDPSLTGHLLYETDFSDLKAWFTNTTSAVALNGTINKKEPVKYAFFVLGKHRIIECKYDNDSTRPNSIYHGTNLGKESLKIISPDMKLNTSLYEKIEVSFNYSQVVGVDSTPNISIYYSTDGGLTFSEKAFTITNKAGKDTFYTYTQASRGRVAKVTFDLKELAKSEIVTNILIRPFGTDNTIVSGGFRMIDFSIVGYTKVGQLPGEQITVYASDYDSQAIQKMIIDAKNAGVTEVCIPETNPRDGSNVWMIGSDIKVPSGMTVYVDNCVLKLCKYSYCNIFTNETGWSSGRTIDNEDKDIHLVGLGNATLNGSIFNGLNERTVSADYMPSLYKNHLIYMRNVNGFSITGFHIVEGRYWTMNIAYCRNGEISYIDYNCNNTVRTNDILDIKHGTNNLYIHHLTGKGGDDGVAMNEIFGYYTSRMPVEGKSTDVWDIRIEDCAYRLIEQSSMVRLLAHDGFKIHDITIKNMYDTSINFTSSRPRTGVLVGDTQYMQVEAMKAGDITGIVVDNFKTKSAYGTVQIGNPLIKATDYKATNCSDTNGKPPVASYRNIYTNTDVYK